MSIAIQKPYLCFPATLVRFLLNSKLRGRTRFTLFLASLLKSLQSVPILLSDGGILYADLRVMAAQGLLSGVVPEQDEQEVMRQAVKSGDVALDIGAHIGYHTLLLSQLVGSRGRVYAFEPNSQLLPALTRTLKGLENTSLFPLALSERSGTAVLYVPEEPSTASLVDWTHGEAGKVHNRVCEQHRLDDLIEAGLILPPNFIKCDVEGAELLVFQGACKTLNRTDAPILLFEANEKAAREFGLTVASTIEFLASLEKPRYFFIEVQAGGSLVPVNTIASTYANILAVPYSKKDALGL